MRKILLLALLLSPLAALAQITAPVIQLVGTPPSGSCTQNLPDQQVATTGALYSCQSGTWALIGNGGGGNLPSGNGLVKVVNGAGELATAGTDYITPSPGSGVSQTITQSSGTQLHLNSVTAFGMSGDNWTTNELNTYIYVDGVNGAGINQDPVAWSSGGAFPWCQGVSYSGGNYIMAQVSGNVGTAPGTNSQIWYPVSNGSVPTQLDCAFYTAAAEIVSGTGTVASGGVGSTIVLGTSGRYFTNIGLTEPTVSSAVSPVVNIIGPGRTQATIYQGASKGDGLPTLYVPDTLTPYAFSTFKWSGFTVDSDYKACPAVAIHGAQQFTMNDILIADATDGCDHEIELGDASSQEYGWVFEPDLNLVDLGTFEGFGSGAYGACTVSDGTPSCTVTAGGSGYASADTKVFLAGTSDFGRPCSSIGTTTATISGGAITAIATTASGCVAPLYPIIFSGPNINYGYKLSNVSDVKNLRNMTDGGVGWLAGMWINDIDNAIKVYNYHPEAVVEGVYQSGTADFYSLQCDTVFQYCVDFEGEGITNLYSPEIEWNNPNMTASRDFYIGNAATNGVPGYTAPQAINVFGTDCLNQAQQPGYAHWDSNQGVIDSSVGSEGAQLPNFVHVHQDMRCSQVYQGSPPAASQVTPSYVGSDFSISNGVFGLEWNFGITTGPESGGGAGSSAMNLTQANGYNEVGQYQFNFQNPTAATSGGNNNSPLMGLCGTYYGSSISNPQCVTQQLTFASGSNPASTFHTSGAGAYTWDNPITLPNGSVATTQASSDNTTKVATDAYVQSNLSTFAPLASPAFTGTPTVPTATAGTNTTQAASTAFVLANSGSSTAVGPNQNIFYLSPNCGSQANCTAANANTKQCSDATITNSSATVTSAGCANFTSADVGKRIWAFATCATDSGASLGAIIGSAAAATISAVGSSTSITISQNATGSQSGTACIIYGTPDDTAQSNVETALASTSANYCPGLQFPSGGMMWTSWHLGVSPAGCARNSEYVGQTAIGGGFNVGGQGRTQSVIYIDPLISMAGCTLSPPLNVNANHGCMMVPQQAEWHDFSFNGGNASRTGVTSAVNLIAMGGYSVIRNMGFTNFGYADNNLGGMYASNPAPVYCINSAFDGWGSTSAVLDPGWFVTSGCDFQDSLGGTADAASIYLTSSADSQFISGGANQFISNSFNSGTVNVIRNVSAGSLVHFLNDQCSGQSNSHTVDCYNTTAANTTWLNGFNCRAAQAASLNVCVAMNGSASVYARDSTFAASSSGYWVNFTAGSGSTFHDMGGNVIVSGTTVGTGGSAWSVGTLVPYASLTGSCTGTATSSSTLGLFGTGPNVTATTCSSTTIGSGQVMGHAGAATWMQVTATTGGVSSSSGVVTLYKNGSSTTLTCTIGTGTSCYDGTHIVSFNAGDLLTLEFTTQASETLAGVKAVLSAY